ncbi:MAG: hypothetical protein VYB05_01570 [Pseudomonadota bacterium]|nr:hypothetical protein [Pseudomonadota bacterium]
MSYVIHTQYGSYCSVCQSPLSMEEADFERCDACDGEGIGVEEDFDPINASGSGPDPIQSRED